MKALTISQPFASLIACGLKFVENRTWPTNYRGPLAIHAGKGTQYMTLREMIAQGVPFGQIVAYAELQACVRTSWSRNELIVTLPSWLSVDEFRRHEHTEGPWCWILGDVRKLETPIDAVGARRLWEWDGWKELV